MERPITTQGNILRCGASSIQFIQEDDDDDDDLVDQADVNDHAIDKKNDDADDVIDQEDDDDDVVVDQEDDDDDDDVDDQEDDDGMEEDEEEPSPEEQARAWMGLQQVEGGPGHDDVCLCHSVRHHQGGKWPISVSISRIL